MMLDHPVAVSLTFGAALARLHERIDTWADEQHDRIARNASRARLDIERRVEAARLLVSYPGVFTEEILELQAYLESITREAFRRREEVEAALHALANGDAPCWPQGAHA